MENDLSNDVIVMESEESQQASSVSGTIEFLADKPLMQFFRRLLLNNVSQNTILTNAQIEDILISEFNFDLSSLHALEVEIYVTVVKKYLKDWPRWDEIESTTKDLTKNGEYDDTFVKALESRYSSLKTFLKTKLNAAKELSAETLTKMKNAEKCETKAGPSAEVSKNNNSSNVVLEIQATRDQLNKLIYQLPHPEHCHTIFNVNDTKPPSHIRVNTLSLEAILNWWSVKITISLHPHNVFLTRTTTHELNHLLVNRKVEDKQSRPEPVYLNEKVQIKETKKARQVSKKQIVGCLELLSTGHDEAMEGMETIIKCVAKDFEGFYRVVGAPALYRRYLSKYPYVRYLYSEVTGVKKIDKTNYDIQLKETISPMLQFYVGRLDVSLEKSLPRQWLKVECVVCNQTFTGKSLATELRQHFDEYHQEEPDWQCTMCQQTFPMAYLAESWWSHACK